MKKLDHVFWQKYFKVYDVLNIVLPYRELMESLVERLNPVAGENILDAGAGTGNLSIRLLEKKAKITAFDSSQEGLDRILLKSPDIKRVLGDLEDILPFDNESFDKIVSNNAIYLTDKKKRPEIFAEFFRVLKPGGILIVSNIHCEFNPLEIYKEHLKKYKKLYGLKRTIIHLIRFIPPTILMFYYNAKVKKSNHGQEIAFITEGEHETLMKEAGFTEINKTQSVYAKQGYLTKGKKPA
jgi:ubiquinone/menaquinone biosynthesis C-methylase UbiE